MRPDHAVTDKCRTVIRRGKAHGSRELGEAEADLRRDSRLLKSLPVLLLVDLRKDILESVVIGFADGILGGEPEILTLVQSETETA